MKNNLLTRGFVISILAFFVFALFLYFSRGVLAPFIIAAFLTYLISPLVRKIMMTGVKRWVAVIFLVALFSVFMVSIISFIIPVITNDINIIIKKTPQYTVYAQNIVVKIQYYLDRFMPFLTKYNLVDIFTVKANSFITAEAARLPKSIFSVVSVMVLVPFLTFFMLLGYKKTVNSIIHLVPAKYVETVLYIFYEIDFVMGKYIRGQIIEVMFVGICSIVGLSILGVHYAFLIGAIAGICNLIPYLGPAVGLITAVTVAAIQFQSMIVVIKVICLFLIIQQMDNHIIQPVVIGQNVNLSPVLMIFALLAGAEIFGFLGIVFAVPVTALLKNIFVMFIRRYKKIY